ncbi:hypothetical protein CHS0354_009817 [Potamilus streckersoni]|uniref:Mitochondrial ribosomal protein S36 n=1 Tax=Potamilus streckersoni TaxID=2493646 RepID=A0AAE0SWB9_9BIVA|nr:hypothetical protein CHS0354_009817 [Potamilus streckersoni]
MATAARVVRTVKPHIPQIKFPTRKADGKATTFAQSAVTPISVSRESTSTNSSQLSTSKPEASAAKGSGIDYAALPARYHRKPISPEEMAYIERGGPE